jgi:hypothetical protein
MLAHSARRGRTGGLGREVDTGLELAGKASDGAEALDLVHPLGPDLALWM